MSDSLDKRAKAQKNFDLAFTQSFPGILREEGITLAVSTYQGNKLIFVSASEEGKLRQLPKHVLRPMGIAQHDGKLAVATLDGITIFSNAPSLARHYPKNPGVYDSFFLPQLTFYTGTVDMHDIHFGKGGLWGVNTAFSCLVSMSDKDRFVPRWKPHFISKLTPEDRCHLNGLAMHEGEPAYVTALGQSDTQGGWRENKLDGGILMDVKKQEIILDGLPMPHSPRYIDGKIYLLLSATGEVVVFDPETKELDKLFDVPGFARGFVMHGDYIFVGFSKIRDTNPVFKGTKVQDKAVTAGVIVYHIPTGGVVGSMHYKGLVEEIYDIAVLDVKRPTLLMPENDIHRQAINLNKASVWVKKKEKKEGEEEKPESPKQS